MERKCPVCGAVLEGADIVCTTCRERIDEREEEKELEAELDEHAEAEPSEAWLFVAAQLRRSPWWCISFLVHALVLLILWLCPHRPPDDEVLYVPVGVNLVEDTREEIEEPEIYEPDDLEEDLEVPIEDIPLHSQRPSLKEPGPDLDMPLVDELFKDDLRPIEAIDPPSSTPVFGVQAANVYNRGIYSGRSDVGKARAIGGRGGSSYGAESAVGAGLRWLARAQEKDGRWSCKRWGGKNHWDVGCTGLALLAFLGAGYTHVRGPYKGTVTRGLRWLKANQKPDGRFNYRTFYEQGIAAMAVSEAYGLTFSPEIGRMAQKSIDYIAKVQPGHGGFRYNGAVPQRQGDMSVTGWQIMALKSGVCSELNVPFQTFDRSRVFLKNAFRKYGGSAYIVERKDSTAAMTAVGMLCRQFIGGPGYDAEIEQAANYLMSYENKVKGPAKGKDRLVGDLYYTYYSVLAMFQYGGKAWAGWNRLFRDTLVRAQVRKTYEGKTYVRGSWDPRNHAHGHQGGRVYCTAMAVLSLEVYYRFLPVYKR